MKSLIRLIFSVNFLSTIAFIIHFIIVFQNLTFNHKDLPDDSVPYYISDDPSDIGEKHSERWGIYWWTYASNSLRILIPTFVTLTLFSLSHADTMFHSFVQSLTGITLVLFLIWEIVKTIWNGWLLLPNNCENHQFCRNFGARRDDMMNEIGENPDNPNYVYLVDFIYGIAFILIDVLYLLLLSYIPRRFEEEKKKTSKKNNNKPYTTIGVWTVGFAVIQILLFALALVFYLPLVYLNFTFTHKNLTDDDVPNYVHDDPGNDTELFSGRSQLYWWLFAFDSLLILFPTVFIPAYVALIIFMKKKYKSFFMINTTIFLLLEIIELIRVIIFLLPPLCSDKHQFCRNFGARRVGGTEIGELPENPNFVYITFASFKIGFVFLLLWFLMFIWFDYSEIMKITKKSEVIPLKPKEKNP